MDLCVHVDELDGRLPGQWEDDSHAANATRLMQLSIGRESVVRDQYGAEVDSDLSEEAVAHPFLFSQEPDGRVSSVLYRPTEGRKSLRLKRMLVSSLQLQRVSRSDFHNTSLLAFSTLEQDGDGPVDSSYSVRKVLFRRLNYTKHLNWKGTKRRPTQIEQRAEVSALVDTRGTVQRLRSELHFSSNISARPHVNGGDDQGQEASRLQFLPVV